MQELTYHQELELKHIDQIREICDQLPSYVRKYFRSLQQTKASRTRLGYAIDIKTFFVKFSIYFNIMIRHSIRNYLTPFNKI